MDSGNEKRLAGLKALFRNWAEVSAESWERLPISGSNRVYVRLSCGEHTAIGVIGENQRENEAFLSFSQSLKKAGVNVPEIYGEDKSLGVYLQQDLGKTSLFDLIGKERSENGGKFTPRLKDVYKRVLSALIDIQTKGRNSIDFSKCYPREAFDQQSMMWDLQYFKYYFLKLAGIAFDEQLLEQDFLKFTNYLLEANGRYFLYRDFQSRNIMVDDEGTPWFIDYQGGRHGARQYDVASLLYDAKADIPSAVRNELLAFYVSRLRGKEGDAFLRYYYGFCIIRIMQAMGAYGYRGFFEKKEHFLKSIPFALNNLKEIISQHELPVDVPELWRVLKSVVKSEKLRSLAVKPKLCVKVSSFSYKHGIPVDVSGNGGGFVFDCRALPNPGREEKYKTLTGLDKEVKDYFAHHKKVMDEFQSGVRALLRISIENYIKREFGSLMVNFGCTGGQHRSVFNAEAAAAWIRENYDVDVVVTHYEIKGRQGK